VAIKVDTKILTWEALSHLRKLIISVKRWFNHRRYVWEQGE